MPQARAAETRGRTRSLRRPGSHRERHLVLLQVPIDPHDSITEDERERDLIGQWCFMATSPPAVAPCASLRYACVRYGEVVAHPCPERFLSVPSQSGPGMIELHTLGAVDLWDAHGAELRGVLAHPKRVALLVYLAVAQPHGFQRRDALLALFLPHLAPQRARRAPRKAAHMLRPGPGAETPLGRGDEEGGLAQGGLRG